MTNYSRTTLRELKKRYLNILKKCLLANLLAFSFVPNIGFGAHQVTTEDQSKFLSYISSGSPLYVNGGTIEAPITAVIPDAGLTIIPASSENFINIFEVIFGVKYFFNVTFR